MTRVLLLFALLAATRVSATIFWASFFFAHGAMFVALWAPMARADANARPLAALGLVLPLAPRHMLHAVMVALLVLPLFWLGTRLCAPALASYGLWPEADPGWRLTVLNGLTLMLTQFLGIALPEELFWRGYVQPVLCAYDRRSFDVFGTPLGFGAAVSSALFALGHVLGGAPPSALATFFPSLMFAWFRQRQGTIFGALTIHALCNITSVLVRQAFDAA